RNTPSPSAVGCSYLSKPTELGSIHSVAYSKRAFEKIASDLPDSQEAMTTWLSRQQGYENYLMKIDGKFIATPSVTTTALLLDHEDERYRSRFTLGEKIN
ncbi:MAG: hypothetical protein KJO60_01775, partial [Desulfofustis sp.]|nr:hypothetical protein [Desulfofustis sp.]